MLRALLAFLALSLFCMAPARAYTPESGLWWNPSESGVGYTFDLQDNFMGMTLYMYAPNGEPDWYIANGFLQGNALFEGTVMRFQDGMCFGCSWSRNSFDRNMGSVRVVFSEDDPTRATMTLGGRTFPIERYQFYLKRPEDGNASIRLTKMLGEWSSTIDLSSVAAPGSYPYSGEILVFDLIDLSEAPGYFEGCRPDNGVVAFCSEDALDFHGAAGFYDSGDRRQVIVVDDSADFFAMYVMQVGTDTMRGTMSVYRKGTEPTQFFPVRGFRTASRTFVEEGVGPAKRAASSGERSQVGTGLGALLEGMGAFEKASDDSQLPDGDAQRLTQIRRSLEQRLNRTR